MGSVGAGFKPAPTKGGCWIRRGEACLALLRHAPHSEEGDACVALTNERLSACAAPARVHGAPFRWDEDRRAHLRGELDAWYARAYGLTRDELRYILDPADVKGPDYPSETFRVLKTNEIRPFGEYRTARLVLQAWDRMERGELAA
jgi:hypothetical protein